MPTCHDRPKSSAKRSSTPAAAQPGTTTHLTIDYAIVADMPDSTYHQTVPEHEQRHRRAITAFLRAGMHDQPSIALTVQALADARRSVAAHQARREPIDGWLAGELRSPGIKENAATLAVLEIPEYRQEISQSYTNRYPDRVAILSELLAVLE